MAFDQYLLLGSQTLHLTCGNKCNGPLSFAWHYSKTLYPGTFELDGRLYPEKDILAQVHLSLLSEHSSKANWTLECLGLWQWTRQQQCLSCQWWQWPGQRYSCCYFRATSFPPTRVDTQACALASPLFHYVSDPSVLKRSWNALGKEAVRWREISEV